MRPSPASTPRFSSAGGFGGGGAGGGGGYGRGGGRLGPGEAVLMRMYGRLALHAESVTLPLLAPDAPVVTWWDGTAPDRIAYDPLGAFAERRIPDSGRAPDGLPALHGRAVDYAPG